MKIPNFSDDIFPIYYGKVCTQNYEYIGSFRVGGIVVYLSGLGIFLETFEIKKMDLQTTL